MYFKPTSILVWLCVLFSAPISAESTPGLGKTISSQESLEIDITVFPDGQGLPPGQGTAESGKTIYNQQCTACHGVLGEGASAKPLAGYPKEGVDWSAGSSWAYATSLFDYIRRAMPPNNVKSLSADEVYSVTAYVLSLNGLLTKEATVNQHNLAEIEMPAQEYSQSKWELLEKAKLYE